MDYKRNLKYFTSKPTMMFIGIAMIAVALFLYFVIGRWVFRYPALIMGVAGLIMTGISFSGKSSDSEMDRQAKNAVGDICETAIQHFEIRDDVMTAFPPVAFGSYDYSERADGMIKKGGDGKYRTDIYTGTAMIITAKKLYIYIKTVDMLKDNEKKSMYDFNFITLSGAEILTEPRKFQMGKTTATTNDVRIKITSDDGKSVEFPVKDDTDADEAVLNINRLIESKKAEIK